MKQNDQPLLQRFCPVWFPPDLLRLLAVLTAGTFLLALTVVFMPQGLLLRGAMLWNLFLAGLPLVFACLILLAAHLRWKPAFTLPLWLLWLFLYPNGPYMLTDLLHLSFRTFWTESAGFTSDPTVWYTFLHLTAGVAVGCCWGLLSLLLLHRYIAQTHGGFRGWLLAGGTSLLSGVGIWIGRCLRFNSWDIWQRPLHLLQSVAAQVDSNAVLLSLLFACMSAGAYVLFHAMMGGGDVHKNSSKSSKNLKKISTDS